MKNLSDLMERTIDQVKANASNKPSLKEHLPRLRESADVKKQLANHLAQCFDIFPLYGREPESAENIRKAFNLQLSEYTGEQITKAFAYHLKVFKDFPVPANIVEIIERNGKPPFERSVYIQLCQKKKDSPESLSRDDWEYMADYERFITTGKY